MVGFVYCRRAAPDRKLPPHMDSLVTSLAFLCLAGILAVAGANGLLKQAQREFQSRLRNAALRRARQLLLAALAVWGGAGLLAAFATPEVADASARAKWEPATPGAAVQLRLDEEINFTGR
jgi:hypothetical protein